MPVEAEYRIMSLGTLTEQEYLDLVCTAIIHGATMALKFIPTRALRNVALGSIWAN